MKFRIVAMFVTANLQNITCVPLATGPTLADQVRLNSYNEDTAKPKCLPLHTVQHPRRSESLSFQNFCLSHQFQHLQHILQSICPTIKIIYAFLVPSHPVYFYTILNVFNVEIREEYSDEASRYTAGI